MPVSAARYNGKLKRDIANEAFAKIGVKATVQEVDEYFRKHYKIPFCERSMYAVAKRKAEGKPSLPPRQYRRNKEDVNFVEIVAQVKQAAVALGGWEELEELIKVLKS